MRSMVKMRGLLHAPFAFKIFSQPVPTRPGTQTFWQVPDPSRPEVKNPYPSVPAYEQIPYQEDYCLSRRHCLYQCSRIRQLFVCSFVCQHAQKPENCTILDLFNLTPEYFLPLLH